MCFFFSTRNFRRPTTHLVDVLALELGDELLNSGILGLDADSGKELLDVASGGGGVTAGLEEQVSSQVLHLRVSRWSKGDLRIVEEMRRDGFRYEKRENR